MQEAAPSPKWGTKLRSSSLVIGQAEPLTAARVFVDVWYSLLVFVLKQTWEWGPSVPFPYSFFKKDLFYKYMSVLSACTP